MDACYEQQVTRAVNSLIHVPGACLLPQAVSPVASCYASGSAVCLCLTESSAQACQLQQHTQHADVSTLPELQQLAADSQGAVEAHVFFSTSEQELSQQHGPALALSPPPDRASSTHSQPLGADTGRWSESSRMSQRLYTPNSWMHPGLQLYLHELQQSQWTASAAAAAHAGSPQPASPGWMQQSGDSSTAACHTSSVHLRSSQQHQQHQQQKSSAEEALLSWLMAIQPWTRVSNSLADASERGPAPPVHTAQSPTDEVKNCIDKQQMYHKEQRLQQQQEGPSAMLSQATVEPNIGAAACFSPWQQQVQLPYWLPGLLSSSHPNLQPMVHIHSTCGPHTGCSSSKHSSTGSCVCLLAAHISTDAQTLLRFSPSALGGDWHLRFLLHQLLHAVAALHARGLAMGGFTLGQLHLICPSWMQVLVQPSGEVLPPPWPMQPQQQQQQQQQQQLSAATQQVCQVWRQGPMVVRAPGYSLLQLTDMWRRRIISNFEYLMWVNAAAGRSWGDRKRHPFVPWVLDFSRRPIMDHNGHVLTAGSSSSSNSSSTVPPGWRDLSISQYRRIKGDAQLDQTYAMSLAAAAAAGAGPHGPWSGCVAGTPAAAAAAAGMDPWAWSPWDGSSSDSSSSSSGLRAVGGVGGVATAKAAVPAVQPHHISNEPMSELSYAIYMARRLPVELLVQLVRRSFRPEEYPSSLEGLYHSSPDEALPQFYCDPAAFVSTHPGMQDLAVPSWAQDAAEFVRIHRAALESDYVSAHLHTWLDLNFGVALSGAAGLAAKNIHLGSTDTTTTSSSSSSSSSRTMPGGAAAAGVIRGMVVPGVEPCTLGVFQLFQQPHPARSAAHRSIRSVVQPTAADAASHESSSSSSTGALSPAATDLLPDQEVHGEVRSRSSGLLTKPPGGPLAVTDTNTSTNISSGSGSSGSSVSDGPPLESCWLELTSLEAAAAMGSWTTADTEANDEPPPVPRTPSTGQHHQQQHSEQLQQQQQQRRQPTLLSGGRAQVGRRQVLHPPAVLLPAEAAAADLAAVGQVALQLYSKQQQEIALGSSAGYFAAEQCRQYCSSCNNIGANSSSGSSPGSRQTGAALQSGDALSGVPPAVSLFVQQCCSGTFSATDLLNVSSFLPGWLREARQFMLQLLFAPHIAGLDGALLLTANDSLQQQRNTAAAAAAAVCSSGTGGREVAVGADGVAWQLGDAFGNLARLSTPGGPLVQLAEQAEALKVCLPAILHVVRGRLLHDEGTAHSSHLGHHQHHQQQQQQQVEAAEPADHHHQQQQQQGVQQQALLLLEAACLVLFRLASVLSRQQVQQHLVPLLCAVLGCEGGSQQPASGEQQQQEGLAAPASCAAATATTAGVTAGNAQARTQHASAVGVPVMPAAMRVAASRRAVLQPALWHVLATKLDEEQLLSALLPPLLVALLEAHTDWLSSGTSTAAAAAALQQDWQQHHNHHQQQQQQAGVQRQQHASQAELACGCLAVLAEVLPFPVVAQHILRPLMLALPTESTGSSSSSGKGVGQAASSGEHIGRPSVTAAGLLQAGAAGAAVSPAFNAGLGLLAVAGVLPLPLTEEFVFQPVLKLALLPLQQQPRPTAAAAAGGGGGPSSAAELSPAGAANTAGHLTLSALPVLEGLLLSLLPLLKPQAVLPSLPGTALAGPGAVHSPPAATAAGSAGLASSSSTAALAGSDSSAAAAAASLNRSGSVKQQQSPAAPAAAAAAALSATGGQAGDSAARYVASGAGGTAAELPALWQLAELLLLTPPDLQAVTLCPFMHARVAALLIIGLEGFILHACSNDISSSSAGGGGSGSGSAGTVVKGLRNSALSGSSVPAGPSVAAKDSLGDAKEQLVALYSCWLLPRVLQPLVSPSVITAWGVPLLQQQQQQQQGQGQQPVATRAFWRMMVLLYAAAVHQLGLSAVRAALPDWHSIEVWLQAETGWEPDPAGSDTDAAARASPVMQLLRALALQGACSPAALAEASTPRKRCSSWCSSSSSGHGACGSADLSRLMLQQVGLLAALQPGSDDGGVRMGDTVGGNISKAAGVQDLLLSGSSIGGGTSSSSNNSSQIAGRVSSLLQRIAEEKVVRRSLNTTHEFLEGVGWSLPRPNTPTGTAAAPSAGSDVLMPAVADAGPLQQQQQQSSLVAAAAAAAAGNFGEQQQQSLVLPAEAAAVTSPDAADARLMRPLPATPPSSPSLAQATAAAAGPAAHNPSSAALQNAAHPAATAAAADMGRGRTATAATSAASSTSRGGPVLPGHAAGAEAAQQGLPGSTPFGQASSSSWAAELSQLRSLLETPTRAHAGERGPSAGKEWFWLRDNPKLDPSHFLPDFSHFPAANAASGSTTPAFYGSWQSPSTSSSRPWDGAGGMWWEQGWRLGAVCLHSWPAHRERLRALAVDPWERLLVTAGRGGAREAGGSSSNWVVRVWELADAEAKVQYAAHPAAVHQVAFLGPASSAVASLDVSGSIHVWSRATGAQLQAFVPLDLAESGAATLNSWSAPAVRSLQPLGGTSSSSSTRSTEDSKPAAAALGTTSSTAMGSLENSRQARDMARPTAAAVVPDSRRGSISTSGPPSGGLDLGASGIATAAGAAADAAAAAVTSGVTVLGGGYWERGCSSGTGWQALSALPTSRQLGAAAAAVAAGGGAAGGAGAGGSSSTIPGSLAASAGGLDAAGAASSALSGPGWPLPGCHLGYTCMVPADGSSNGQIEATGLADSSAGGYGSNGSSSGLLLAGTADGHVCLLDVETGALLQDYIACWDSRLRLYSSSAARSPAQLLQQQQVQANPLLAPAGMGAAGWDGLNAAADPSSCVLSSVCCSSRASNGGLGQWVGAGSGGGRITLLDMRAGMIVASWQGHGQRVSQLQGLSGSCGEHLLLSSSSDKTMKLWDLRMMPQAAGPHASLSLNWHSSSSSSSSSSGGMVAPLTTFKSASREGIEGFVLYQDAAIVYGGTSLGLAPLDLSNHSAAPATAMFGGLTGQLQHQQHSSSVQLVRMTAVRGLGYRASGGREGLGAAGAGAVVGLGLLPHSKLLVVGTEDGLLRICW